MLGDLRRWVSDSPSRASFVREGSQVHVCDVDTRALAALSRARRKFRIALRCIGRSLGRALLSTKCPRVTEVSTCWLTTPALPADTRCETLRSPMRNARWPSIDRSVPPVCPIGNSTSAREQQCKHINLSSGRGALWLSLRTPYAAAKWAVIGFTKSLSIELGSDGDSRQRDLPGIGWPGLVSIQMFANKAATARGLYR